MKPIPIEVELDSEQNLGIRWPVVLPDVVILLVVPPEEEGDISDVAPAAGATGKERQVSDALDDGERATIHPLFGVRPAIVIDPFVPANRDTLVSGNAFGERLTRVRDLNVAVLRVHIARLIPRCVPRPHR